MFFEIHLGLAFTLMSQTTSNNCSHNHHTSQNPRAGSLVIADDHFGLVKCLSMGAMVKMHIYHLEGEKLLKLDIL